MQDSANDFANISKGIEFIIAATSLCMRTPHAPELAQAVVPILSVLDSELSGLMRRPDGMRVANNYYRELQKFMDMRRREFQIPDAPDCPEVDGKLIAARQETMAATQAYLDQGGYELIALSRLVKAEEEKKMPTPITAIWSSSALAFCFYYISRAMDIKTAASLGVAAGTLPLLGFFAYSAVRDVYDKNKLRDFRTLLDKYGHGKEDSPLALEVAIVKNELVSMSFENLVPLITLPRSFAAQLTRYLQAKETPHRSVASLMQRAAPAPAPAVAA